MNKEPLKSIDLQELGAEFHSYGELDDPVMRDFNPAIAWEGDQLRISVRRCNFAVKPKGKFYFRDGSVYSRTDVMYGYLDPDTLQVSKLRKLHLSEDTPTRIKVHGLEDVRLFWRNDEMHAVGFESDRLSVHLHNASAKMAEFLIKGDQLVYLRTLDKPSPKIVEKNWCPPDKPSKLFEFTYSDSQVYKNGTLIGNPTTTNIHGGSILLEQEDGTYLSLVHEKKLDTRPIHRSEGNVYDKYIYYTYLARHNEQGIITQLSMPFRFGTLENIEFASGLAEYKDSFIITLGVRDCKYMICKIPKYKLLGLM